MIQHTGTLYIVATPIGNLDDISARALQTLRTVDVIAAEDTRHTGRLLHHFGIQQPMLAVHEHNEQAILQQFVDRLTHGTQIALVSDAGTPLISDPGFPIVRACRAAGIPVVPIPGPSALITALSVAGLPTDAFYFAGFPPRKQTARRAWLGTHSTLTATLIYYESAHRVLTCLHDMCEQFGADRQAVCARELTKRYETIVQGSLAQVIQQMDPQPKGEIVLLIAGNDTVYSAEHMELDHCLRTLMAELPLKQAVGLAAKLLKQPKNKLYQHALAVNIEPVRP